MSLNHSSAGARANGPHLESLDGTAAEQVTAMAWARYLGSAFGSSGAIRALRFYRDVDWISRDVYQTMVDYVRGLSVDELTEDEDAIARETSIDSLADTPYDRHARSLEFVAAIAGDSIERDLTTLRLGDDVLGTVTEPDDPDESEDDPDESEDAPDDIPSDGQCAATTENGEDCTLPSLDDHEYCHVHREDTADEE